MATTKSNTTNISIRMDKDLKLAKKRHLDTDLLKKSLIIFYFKYSDL